MVAGARSRSGRDPVVLRVLGLVLVCVLVLVLVLVIVRVRVLVRVLVIVTDIGAGTSGREAPKRSAALESPDEREERATARTSTRTRTRTRTSTSTSTRTRTRTRKHVSIRMSAHGERPAYHPHELSESRKRMASVLVWNGFWSVLFLLRGVVGVRAGVLR